MERDVERGGVGGQVGQSKLATIGRNVNFGSSVEDQLVELETNLSDEQTLFLKDALPPGTHDADRLPAVVLARTRSGAPVLAR